MPESWATREPGKPRPFSTTPVRMILASRVPFARASTQSRSKVPGANAWLAEPTMALPESGLRKNWVPLTSLHTQKWRGKEGGNPGNCTLTKTSYNVEFAHKGDPDRYCRGRVECSVMDWEKKIQSEMFITVLCIILNVGRGMRTFSDSKRFS